MIAKCDIQPGCVFPAGHLDRCRMPEGNEVHPAWAKHAWSDRPELYKSGKVNYLICPTCHCLQEHEVHGGASEALAVPPDDRSYLKGQAAAQTKAAEPETIEQLLARLQQVMPEPSLMDIEDGGGSQGVLLQRFGVLAMLHQAQQLKRIGDVLEKLRLSAPRVVSYHAFVSGETVLGLQICNVRRLERTHPVHG